MNERKEMAQDRTRWRTGKEPRSPARASMNQGSGRTARVARAGTCLDAGASQTHPRASPQPPQPTRDRGVRAAKDRNFHDLFYTRAHTHMRAVEGFPAAPENTMTGALPVSSPSPLPTPENAIPF